MVKTGEGERARERKKNIRRTVGDKCRDRVAGYQGIDPGVEPRRARRGAYSRSGRVSSRSVALFVNAELRARARVTGSSRKASWGFMVPPFGADQRRQGRDERRRGRENGGPGGTGEGGEGEEGRMAAETVADGAGG